MTGPTPRETRALGLYRILFRLLPEPFRRRRREEMESLFLAMYRERRGTGVRTAVLFWVPLVWDVLSNAVRERVTPTVQSAPGWVANSHTSSGDGFRLAFLLSDVRFALRSLRRRPVYAGLVILMMTLGIAGNAAVFRIFNGLFLKSLPFDEASELVDLDTRAPHWDLEYTGVAYADFAAWRAENSTFQGMGAYTIRGANLTADGPAVRVDVVLSTWDLPSVVGLEPVRGRLFTADEDVPGGPDLALLSRAFWLDRFGGAPGVVGRSLLLDGDPYEIVGVLPATSDLIADADVWVPLRENPDEHSSFYLTGVGRLRPDVSLEGARTDLATIHDRLAERWDVNEQTSPVVSSLRDRYLGEMRLGTSVLLGAVAVVLLIACANIAGLTLARSLERGREVAVRLAMGAGRRRIVSQLLVEGLTLAALGALVGTVVGVQGSALLVSGLHDQFPPWVGFELDGLFVLFTVAVTVAAAVLFGLLPALNAAGAEPVGALHGGRGATASSGRRRVMSSLVVAEIALAFVLLVVAGVSLRDLQAIHSTRPGFRTEGVLTYVVQLPAGRYPDDDSRLGFWHEHLEKLRALPGVEDAAASTVMPLSGHSGWFFDVEDAPPRAENEPNPVVLLRAVSPGYLDAMDVELLAGRGLTEFDGRDDGSAAVVVNETFVREFLGHRAEPLGARIRTGGDDEPWLTVVGINRDTKHYGLDEEMRPAVHLPLRLLPLPSVDVAITTMGDPTSLTEPARHVLAEQDPGLAAFDMATMRHRLDESLWPRRASAWLILAFSATALILAVSGIYGVISYTVRQRVREIGIRMALGARRGEVARGVVAHGLRLVVGGSLIGLTAAYLVAPHLSGALVRASPSDPLVYAVVTAVVVGVAVLANLLPARRAARLEPMGVLKGE